MYESLREWEPRILSVLRIVIGLLFLQHGLTKLVGFPGTVPANMPTYFWFINIPLETVGSLLLIFGLFTRPVALLLSGEMAVAYWYAHFPRNPFPYNNGGSIVILYTFVFLYIVFAGPGPWSVDAMRGGESRRPAAA